MRRDPDYLLPTWHGLRAQERSIAGKNPCDRDKEKGHLERATLPADCPALSEQTLDPPTLGV